MANEENRPITFSTKILGIHSKEVLYAITAAIQEYQKTCPEASFPVRIVHLEE